MPRAQPSVSSSGATTKRSFAGESLLLTTCVIALILAATSRWHYFAYVLLRLLICASSAFAATKRHFEGRSSWVWVFGAIAVLFNPIFPARMARSDWQVINIITATFFACGVLVMATRDRLEA